MTKLAQIVASSVLLLAISPIASASDPYGLACPPVEDMQWSNDAPCVTSGGHPGFQLILDPVLRTYVPDMSVLPNPGDPPVLLTCIESVTVQDLSRPRTCVCQPLDFTIEPEAIDCPPWP